MIRLPLIPTLLPYTTLFRSCYGGETWPYVHSVETINRQGETKTRPAADFQYTYRHVDVPDNEWFVAAHFTLQMGDKRSEEHTSELQSQSNLVCRLLLEKKNI